MDRSISVRNDGSRGVERVPFMGGLYPTRHRRRHVDISFAVSPATTSRQRHLSPNPKSYRVPKQTTSKTLSDIITSGASAQTLLERC